MRNNEYFSEDRHVAMQQFRDLVNDMPERATQVTQAWIDDMEITRAKISNFADLIDEGFFTGHLTPEEDKAFAAEIVALGRIAQRKIDQHALDIQTAQNNLTRRTLWDFVLIRRLLGWWR